MKKNISILLILLILLSLIGVSTVFANSLTTDELGISIDGGYLIEGNQTDGFYVRLPAGRPRIPLISCDIASEIYQPKIPDGETKSIGKVIVENNEYIINFVKESSNGFYLQFDDRYVFTPNYNLSENGVYEFESSDNSIATVDKNGVVTAVGLTDSAVIITAKVDGNIIDTLTIDKIEKTVVNLFLVIGQSNAEGHGANQDVSLKPDLGTAYLYTANKLETLYGGWIGFTAPLATQNYRETGEKPIMIPRAVGGTYIIQWDPNPAEANNKFSLGATSAINDLSNFLNGTGKYEIRTKGYFWHQGESDCIPSSSPPSNPYWTQTPDRIGYYNTFMKIHNYLKANADIDFGAILILGRWQGGSTTLIPVRLAQYDLCANNPDIYIATRKTETIDINRMMPIDQIHYIQFYHNMNGIDAATNTFSNFSAKTDRKVKDINLYYNDTKNIMDKNEIFYLSNDDKLQLLALPEPTYSKYEQMNMWIDGDSVVLDSETDTITPVENAQGLSVLNVSYGDFIKQYYISVGSCATAGINSTSENIVVEGSVGNSNKEVVSILMVKNEVTDLSKIKATDIGYIGSVNVKSMDGTYSHKFTFSQDIKNYKLYIKSGSTDLTGLVDVAYSTKNMYNVDVQLDIENTGESSALESKLANVKIEVENIFGNKDFLQTVLAYYDETGKLIETKVFSKSQMFYDKTTLKNLSTTIPEGTNLVKVYVWDGVKTMIPLANSKSAISGDTVIINDDSTKIVYTNMQSEEKNGAYLNDCHIGLNNNSSFEYAFVGSGIQLFMEMGPNYGFADIYIDGKFAKTVNCNRNSTIQNVSAYMISGLDVSQHIVKAVKRSGEKMVLDMIKAYQRPIKVACVGDSITAGYYPKLLQNLLGDGYNVVNYGEGSKCITKGVYDRFEGFPYWDTEKYTNSLEFAPDIVISGFGANDCAGESYDYSSDFVPSYREFIDSYKSQEQVVSFYVLSTPLGGRGGTKALLTLMPEIADTNNCLYINGNARLADDVKYLSDGIHPNLLGAQTLAEEIYQNILNDR